MQVPGPHIQHPKPLDRLPKIDCSKLPLAPDGTRIDGRLCWQQRSDQAWMLTFSIHPDRLALFGGERSKPRLSEHRDTIDFTFTAQPFGGQRRWFSCPECRNRIRVLFLVGTPRCRKCVGSSYSSQLETTLVSGLERALEIRKKLGGHSGIACPFPGKPRGMHWKTWYRLRDQDDLVTMKLFRMTCE
jgi:hypothetical protein